MWFSRKRQMNNAAAGTLSQRPTMPPPVINNYNQTPWGQIIFSATGAIIGLLIFLWFAVVYLTERQGYQNPDREAASCILGLAFWGIILSGVLLAARLLLNRWFEHRETLAGILLEIESKRLLAAQSSVDGIRANAEDIPFAKLIIAVMFEAYEHGPRGLRGGVRWSRRNTYALSNQHRLGLSERKCGEVSTWLLQHGVITDKDEINTRQFADLGDVKRLVSKTFNVPVTTGNDIGMSGHQLYGQTGDTWG